MPRMPNEIVADLHDLSKQMRPHLEELTRWQQFFDVEEGLAEQLEAHRAQIQVICASVIFEFRAEIANSGSDDLPALGSAAADGA